MGLRSDIETVLKAELSQPVAVYGFPVEVPILPAVILAPGDPYQAPLTFGKNGRASSIIWQMRISILEPRAEPSTSLDALEARRLEITDALAQIPGAQWSSLDSVGEMTVADVPAIGGTVNVTIRRGDIQ